MTVKIYEYLHGGFIVEDGEETPISLPKYVGMTDTFEQAKELRDKYINFGNSLRKEIKE